MATVDIDEKISERLVARAEDELRRGKRVQACETAWGATDQALKTVARARGWRGDSRGALFGAIANIAELSGDAEFYTLFDSANLLRDNILEGWLSDEYISDCVDSVKTLLEKLRAFMDADDNGASG